jgi:hypothetical protein
MTKKDPEGRNMIVLCLVFASFDVLEAIVKFFEEERDIKSHIIKEEYDGNPSINLAMSLCGIENFRERTEKLINYLLSIMNKETQRFCNVQDRLGRTCLHIACKHGLP